MAWINEDGLELKFGAERTDPTIMGEFYFPGPRRCFEITFTHETLPVDADGSVLINDQLALPIGAVIEAVEIINHEDVDSAGDGFVLDVGTIDLDRTSNADPDGLVDAATQTEMNTGGTNIAGWVGDDVNAAPLTAPRLITWETTVADATAGSGMIRVYYSVHADS